MGSILVNAYGPITTYADRNATGQPYDLIPAEGAELYIHAVTTVGGQVWYRVQYRYGRDQETFAWVNLDDGRSASMTTEAIPCPPSTPTPEDLDAWAPLRYACYGARDFTFSRVMIAKIGLARPEPRAYQGSPAWLAEHAGLAMSTQGNLALGGEFIATRVIVAPEARSQAVLNRWLTVTVRLGDPRSSQCAFTAVGPGIPTLTHDEAVLVCRQNLVVVAARPAPSH